MFNNSRFITRGVQSQISLPLQIILWELVSTVPDPDYLQVFRLSSEVKDGKKIQIIQQSQEVPEFSRTYSFYCDEPVTAKLFCIDDVDHITLLLAEEY